jgi:hypothetical protein
VGTEQTGRRKSLERDTERDNSVMNSGKFFTAKLNKSKKLKKEVKKRKKEN